MTTMRTPLKKVRGPGLGQRRHRSLLAAALTGASNRPADAVPDLRLPSTWPTRGSCAVRSTLGASADRRCRCLLFVSSAAIHMRLGMQVIIEDYIARRGRSRSCLLDAQHTLSQSSSARAARSRS